MSPDLTPGASGDYGGKMNSDRSMIARHERITRPVPVILPFSQHSELHPACNNKRGTLDGVSRFCYFKNTK